ncbi:hypothetical protein H5410_027591 [Solanum commersonii]|uniref:Uncharacterized protein n=1 Tax=Solanum commersonii TaxID=4109 RepID=A0A9J5YZL4_SOLCO|nr:hypothetical protein H5410_027591 [Solanum commersonii]
MKGNKTKVTWKLATKDNLYNKRKKNGKHKNEKNNKQQEEKAQKAVWRPISPHNRRTTQQAGITNNPNHNSFTNLNMQELQHEDMEEPTKDGTTQTQGAIDMCVTDPNQAPQSLKKGNKEYNKNICIGSMLPSPIPPNNVNIDCNVEVEGGWMGEVRRYILTCRKGDNIQKLLRVQKNNRVTLLKEARRIMNRPMKYLKLKNPSNRQAKGRMTIKEG